MNGDLCCVCNCADTEMTNLTIPTSKVEDNII